MPVVKITQFECERNLLPHMCAKCGIPADDCVRFTPLKPALNYVMGFLLIACPPLFVGLALYLQRKSRRFNVPMCEKHRIDWEWRDRVTSWSYLIVVVIFCTALVLAIFSPWDVPFWPVIAAYLATWCYWVIPATILWTRTIRATGIPSRGMQLAGVHADFIRALAKDRVHDGDPARLAWFGDARDDFDEDQSWLQSMRNDPIRKKMAREAPNDD